METHQTDIEKQFEQQLLDALCNRLVELGEIATREDFLNSYPKENLSDFHNGITGAYYLMNREKPLKIVEYNLRDYTVTEVKSLL